MVFSSRLLLPFLFISLFWVNGIQPVLCFYETMFTFGDSVTDTGNNVYLGFQPPVSTKNPYGMTYFYSPNGRYCNGRLIIDFIAASQGFPFLHPYTQNCDANFEHGVNFAVGGATVLSRSFYEKIHMDDPYTNYSMEVQLGWFEDHLASLCNSTAEYKDVLNTSLIFLGEMGGDDYTASFTLGRPVEEVRTFVPLVVRGISQGVQKLINLGAVTIVVPGIFPLGCNSVLLTYFEDSSKESYDEIGCLIWINQLAEQHNYLLQNELQRLREAYTNATIVYADYSKVVIPIYQNPQKYGFNKNPLVGCCGNGGKYNFNLSMIPYCGPKSPHICTDPWRYVVWDGYHFTERVYGMIADAILSGEILTPSIDISRPALQQNYGYFDQK